MDGWKNGWVFCFTHKEVRLTIANKDDKFALNYFNFHNGVKQGSALRRVCI